MILKVVRTDDKTTYLDGVYSFRKENKHIKYSYMKLSSESPKHGVFVESDVLSWTLFGEDRILDSYKNDEEKFEMDYEELI